MEHIFRAYDVRGIFNKELTPEVASRIGSAFGTYLGGDVKVLTARDGRTSSKVVESALISGLASTGCDCISTGLVPIPTANFKIIKGSYNAGAYVTASHNPPEYNGVRFRHGDGTGYTRENSEVKDIFFSGNMLRPDWNHIGSIEEVNPEDTIEEYSKFLLSKFNIEKKLKAVLDTGNGASALTAPRITSAAGLYVSTINSKIDGNFPGRPSEPSDKTLGDLKRKVVSKGADFGAGYDGDGDRGVFVDDRGRVAQAEKIGVIISKDLLRKRGGTILANVSCSLIIEREIEKLGGRVVRVRVGDVFIAEGIKKYRAIFAMETSSHFFLPEFYIFDDPLLVTLKLAEVLSKTDRKLSEMLDDIPSYPRLEENFHCPDSVKFSVMENIIKKLKSKNYMLDQTDGVKVIFEDGWVLLRPSNTNPLVRAVAEAETDKRVKELLDMVRKEFDAARKEKK